MAGPERVVLYVGAPKTGTTSVQSFLRENDAALSRQGFCVPRAGRGGIGQHIELPTFVHTPRKRNGLERHADLGATDLKARRADFLRDLAAELARAPDCHTVLFSSEYMFSSNLAEIRAYREMFAPFAPRLESLMYLRRQDQWLASLTLQARKSGARQSLDLNPGNPPLFAGSVRAWDAQSDTCHIRRLDRKFLRHGDLLEDFCHTMNIDPSGMSMGDSRANPAILQEQLELVDALNARIKSFRFQRQLLFRTRFIQMCTELLGGAPVQFDREAAKSAFISFKSVNTWLRKTRDPEGPKLFFDADFSGYADAASNDREYTTEQLASLLSAIGRLLEERGLPAPNAPPGDLRRKFVHRIIAGFVTLRGSELEAQRRSRVAARAAEASSATG